MTRQDPDQLSVDDAHILALESETITGHTLKVIVLEPSTTPLDLDALGREVAQRLPSQPRATERIDISGPSPHWVQATDFDIRDHVRRRSGPECVSRADLWRSLSVLMSEHLDRSCPLWTFDLIGPMGDGREAIAVRIHHAMTDGIAAVRFLNAVLWDRQTDPSSPAAASPGIRSAATEPSRLTEALRMPAAMLRELGRPASASPFDRPICIARELAFTDASLADIRAIGDLRPVHATVNDVLLAIVAGGLRGWLAVSGTASRRLRAQVPVSLHHRDEQPGELGNRDSFMNIDLPIGQADPLLRLDLITAETRKRKRLNDAEELYDLFHALGRIKHIGSAAQRLAGSAREFSLSISNVPGPPAPVSVAGRRVEHVYSSSEPAAHHALRISAVSCVGKLEIGLCTDPYALPGVAGLADAIESSYAELHSAATR
ncbi:MAG: wax ester/triacylglycerol synthase family O-acyltransferase [Mycobacterium sp.]